MSYTTYKFKTESDDVKTTTLNSTVSKAGLKEGALVKIGASGETITLSQDLSNSYVDVSGKANDVYTLTQPTGATGVPILTSYNPLDQHNLKTTSVDVSGKANDVYTLTQPTGTTGVPTLTNYNPLDLHNLKTTSVDVSSKVNGVYILTQPTETTGEPTLKRAGTSLVTKEDIAEVAKIAPQLAASYNANPYKDHNPNSSSQPDTYLEALTEDVTNKPANTATINYESSLSGYLNKFRERYHTPITSKYSGPGFDIKEKLGYGHDFGLKIIVGLSFDRSYVADSNVRCYVNWDAKEMTETKPDGSLKTPKGQVVISKAEKASTNWKPLEGDRFGDCDHVLFNLDPLQDTKPGGYYEIRFNWQTNGAGGWDIWLETDYGVKEIEKADGTKEIISKRTGFHYVEWNFTSKVFLKIPTKIKHLLIYSVEMTLLTRNK